MSGAEAEVMKDAPGGETPEDKPKQQREQSTIEFPYLSLDVAVEIVKAINATGGQAARIEQVAAHLGEKPNTGAFRNKLATARTFGLSTYSYSAGTATLTPLGLRVADPDQEKAAKAEAFLQVPLYGRVYEKFKGVALPPTPQALEAEMAGMGVAAKQKDKARQVFQRSAGEAGFFAYGTTKLVYPTVGASGNTPKPKEKEDATPDPPKGGNNGGSDGGGQHPLIEGLLTELPPPKTEWSMEERKNWLEMASTIFNVIYRNSDGSREALRVVVEKASAK